MAVEVHADKAGDLHEAGINAAQAALVAQWHAADQVLLEPFDRMAHGELIHASRVDAGVDRPRHQGHAVRLAGVVVLRHHGSCNQRRYRRLAYSEEMGAFANQFEKMDDVIDEFVKAKAAFKH